MNTNILRELATRIAKTKQWKEVTSKRRGMVTVMDGLYFYCDGGNTWVTSGHGYNPFLTIRSGSTANNNAVLMTAVNSGPDLSLCAMLLLDDLPDHSLIAHLVSQQTTVYSCCAPGVSIQDRILASKPEVVATEWLALFEGKVGG